MVEHRTFYAIYDPIKKVFKGRGNTSRVRWSKEPTQTYDSFGRADGARKSHIKAFISHQYNKMSTAKDHLVVKEITVSWEIQ